MDWTEIVIEIAADDIDKAAAIANMAVPYGIYIEDYRTLREETLEIANIDLIDEELLKKDKSRGFIHLYIPEDQNPAEAVSYLSERFNAENIKNEINLSKCKNEDWENNWKEYFKPIKVGKRLLIRPLWIDDYDNSEGRAVLSIEPGLAFGTGGHNTTRLCLEALEKYVFDGASVFDAGCGSGILSIASLLLGADSAIGTDIDSLAVKTARENGKENGFSEPRLTFREGSLADGISGKFDIITANIVADIVMFFLPQAIELMHKKSVFIASGIIAPRKDEVRTAILNSGLCIAEEYCDGDWYCFVCKKQL